MKLFQILFVFAGLFYLIGVLFAISPIYANTKTATFSIPSGPYYYSMSFNLLPWGSISGSFSESAGHTVNIYILNDEQLTAYSSSGQSQSIFSTSGPSGSFSASVSAVGRYSIVAGHGLGYEQTSQQLQVNYTVYGEGLPLW